MQEFRNSNQMKAFMKKEANRLGMNINNVYITYVSRVLLQKISRYNDGRTLIKGSSAETAYLGKLVRGITDVDIASVNNLEANFDILKKVLHDKEISNISFKINKRPTITNTGIYKIPLLCSFDKMKQPLGIDFQEKYNRLIELEEKVMPKIFDEDEEFVITVPSFEEYLAEKLCIVVESNKPDVLNTRVKDFYDIYELHGGKYNPEKLTKYFKKMLLLRGKIKFNDAKTTYLDRDFVLNHDSIWKSTKEKYDFLDSKRDLYGAVYYTRAVLREELHKNGAELPIDIDNKEKKKIVY